MFTLHISSHWSSFIRRGLAVYWVLLAMALGAQAQTKASCMFNFFSRTTNFTLPDGRQVFIEPLGINDFGTIVGSSTPGPSRGLIRWANGGITHVKGTSLLVARNDHGTSVGLDLTGTSGEGVLVNGTTITPIVLDVNNGGVNPFGINKWGTIVGQYATPDFSSSHGFKRWKNGTTHNLDFPGSLPNGTWPYGINDHGTVVGFYFGSDGLTHGFIFHNGQWATLDYPHASATFAMGISNAGKIIGNAIVVDATGRAFSHAFLYENGTFKLIPIPGPKNLVSISPKQELILGDTGLDPSQPSFIAKCQ
jgi:probable HAF family extracellular repeat protein